MNKTPLHIKARRFIRSYFNRFLSFLFGKTPSNEPLNIQDIETIVLIRPNYRIGNLIFLTPLINEIYAHNPNIKIDLIVGFSKANEIFSPMPNIDQVISIPRKLLIHPIQLFKFIQRARKKRYDVAIILDSGSVSSQIVLSLINSKYKIGFKDNKRWANVTHEVVHNGPLFHSSLIPLSLLNAFSIYDFITPQILDLKLSDEELQEAQQDLNKLNAANNSLNIAFFRGARYEKKLPDKWWSDLTDTLVELNPNITLIDILSPDVPTPLNDKVLSYSNKNLRKLCAFFGACDMFIIGDTGPLHLAAASKTQGRGIFHSSSIVSFGLIGDHNKNIEINNKSIQEIAKECLE